MRTKQRKLPVAVCIAGLLLSLACDATFSVGYPTATPAPPTALPTSTLPSLNLTLMSPSYSENTQSPPSSITAVIPQLTGSDDQRVAAFNEAVNLLMAAEIEVFKNGLVGLPSPPAIAVSTFDATYEVIYQGGDLWSIRFDLAVYVDGAAHSGDLVRTFNYDFGRTATLDMDDLFLPGSNYLQVISDYCSKELATREIGFNETTVGAEPTPQNYRNWNITPAGLLITFERGQVTAYAAPAQVVTIPFQELKSIINTQGALGGLVNSP
jgi:hypothetical protein